jgi:hypothetical protein
MDAARAPNPEIIRFNPNDRRHFIGGSDARIIMGEDQDRLSRLWREKRGEVEPEDLSDNLIVQLGTATEALNRAWYQRSTGQTITDVQKRVRHPMHKWMAATLDGMVEPAGAVFEAKFMLPWTFTEEAAAEKHMAQLQHNMWVVTARSSVLSIITGGGKWVEIKIYADPLYQHLLLTAERKFWRCVQSGEPPLLFNIETPRPRLEAVKVVDMASSNPRPSLRRRIYAPKKPTPSMRSRRPGSRSLYRRTPGSERPRHQGQAVQVRRYQLRHSFRGDVQCIKPVNASARLRRRWPGPRLS